ncbi:MAG: hypothetical protein Q9227_002379 [Pyrenula ochraceoflavens]
MASRRKPRRIAQEEEDEIEDNSEPVVRRPNLSGPKQKSKLRMSFAPDEVSNDLSHGEQEASYGQPQRLGQAKPSQKTSLRAATLERLPVRSTLQEDRPTYSQDYLTELRSSTSSKPTTPADSNDEDAQPSTALQNFKINEPFGTAIPSAAEIAEKKERRARLAKEQEYISLEDDDEHDWRISLHKGEQDTRLLRDDEDFAEGFDEFVEDGKIALGKKAERAQKKMNRAQMQELIDNAEESSDDDSEAERNLAYEEAQTRAGMDGLAREDAEQSAANKRPPNITPIPRLSAVIEKFRSRLQEAEQRRDAISKQREALQQEKVASETRLKEIQALVTETGEKYEKARLEAGVGNETPSSSAVISAAQTPDATIESG